MDGHLNPVALRVDGTIKAVHADDNESVQAGALLIELDPSDDQISMQQRWAQYDQGVAQLGAADPNLSITRLSNRNDLSTRRSELSGTEAALAAALEDLASASAKLRESEVVSTRNQADLARYQTLFDKQEVAPAEYDQYKAIASAQSETVASNQAAVASAEQIVQQRMAQVAEQNSKLQQTQRSGPLQVAIRQADIKGQWANAEAAQAALAQSKLNLTYGLITAPVSGIVSQRSAEIGAGISKGQQLFMIVQTSDLWVTANFKELSWPASTQASRFVFTSMRSTTISKERWKACLLSRAPVPVFCLPRTQQGTT